MTEEDQTSGRLAGPPYYSGFVPTEILGPKKIHLDGILIFRVHLEDTLRLPRSSIVP